MSSLHYRPTRADLLDACRLHHLSAICGRRTVLAACTLSVGFGVLADVLGGASDARLIVGIIAAASMLAIAALALGLRHAVLPLLLVRRQLKEQHYLQNEWILSWSEHGYALRSETGSSELAWRHYVRWREDGRVILLYASWQSYQFVPKRILPPDAAHFIRSQLEKAGVRKAPRFLS